MNKKITKLPDAMSNHVVTSFSMPLALRRRLAVRLPRHGDRSKLVQRMLELWLDDELHVTGLRLRSLADEAEDFEPEFNS